MTPAPRAASHENGPHDLQTLSGHQVRCSQCRATWSSQATAEINGGRGPCPGHPLCHGALYDRLHYVQTRWEGLSTDALCDWPACPVCRAWPPCPCCVCRDALTAPALHTVYEDPVLGFTDNPFEHLKEVKTRFGTSKRTTVALPGRFCDWFESTRAYADTPDAGQDAVDFKTVYKGGRIRTIGTGYTRTISVSTYELRILKQFARAFARLCNEESGSQAARRANVRLQQRLTKARADLNDT